MIYELPDYLCDFLRFKRMSNRKNGISLGESVCVCSSNCKRCYWLENHDKYHICQCQTCLQNNAKVKKSSGQLVCLKFLTRKSVFLLDLFHITLKVESTEIYIWLITILFCNFVTDVSFPVKHYINIDIFWISKFFQL